MKTSTSGSMFKRPFSVYKFHLVFTIIACIALDYSCSKSEISKQSFIRASNTSQLQIDYLTKVKGHLRDSMQSYDFTTVNFTTAYQSRDVNSKNYFLRLGINNKTISTDFILLKTDSLGNLIKGKIVHVNKTSSKQAGVNTNNYAFTVSSLNRKSVNYISNTDSHNDLKEEEEPVGEQTLEDVVVTCYIYDDYIPIDLYFYDGLLNDGGGGGGVYTYGQANPGGGGGGGIQQDPTSNIATESNSQPGIDITKYIKCFSSVSNQNAVYKVTIYSDIPVNGNPNDLFNFNTGEVGHTFLQLTKTSGSNSVTQNLGFYPQTGWKSIVANSPVTSKMVDNAGHEFNASLTINVDATHFQNALNQMQVEKGFNYDIDNFNCTDFALSVFNAAASTTLYIPQMHIPGGLADDMSNTPQGLYKELSILQSSGGYSGAQISIPGVAGYVGNSHGACN